MGEQIRDNVIKLLQQTGAAQVDIVAYSMGALAVRHFLQCLKGRSSVRRFISLAAPQHGTLTAYLRQNVGSRQMRPGSPFLRNLNAKDNQLGDVELYSFWTPLDLMVLPIFLIGATILSINICLPVESMSPILPKKLPVFNSLFIDFINESLPEDPIKDPKLGTQPACIIFILLYIILLNYFLY